MYAVGGIKLTVLASGWGGFNELPRWRQEPTTLRRSSRTATSSSAVTTARGHGGIPPRPGDTLPLARGSATSTSAAMHHRQSPRGSRCSHAAPGSGTSPLSVCQRHRTGQCQRLGTAIAMNQEYWPVLRKCQSVRCGAAIGVGSLAHRAGTDAVIRAPVMHPRCGHRLRCPSGLHNAPI